MRKIDWFGRRAKAQLARHRAALVTARRAFSAYPVAVETLNFLDEFVGHRPTANLDPESRSARERLTIADQRERQRRAAEIKQYKAHIAALQRRNEDLQARLDKEIARTGRLQDTINRLGSRFSKKRRRKMESYVG